MRCPPVIRFAAAALPLAAGCSLAAAAAVTERWGAELRIDERESYAVQQTYGGSGADDDRFYTLSGRASPGNEARLLPIAEATTSGELKALALIGYELPSWTSLRGRAWAETRVDDLLRVQVDGALPGGQLSLRFKVQLDGEFWSQISSAATGNERLKDMNYQFYDMAWLFAEWQNSSDLSRTQQTLFDNSMHRLDGAIGDFALLQSLIPFAEDPRNSRSYLSPDSNSLLNELTIARDRTYSVEIPINAGEALDFSLALAAGAALTLENLDFYFVEGQVHAGFQHTASITSVELLDADGRSFVGRWHIDSALGIDYPETIVGGNGAVPLPGTLALALAGLWPAWRIRSARRCSC